MEKVFLTEKTSEAEDQKKKGKRPSRVSAKKGQGGKVEGTEGTGLTLGKQRLRSDVTV